MAVGRQQVLASAAATDMETLAEEVAAEEAAAVAVVAAADEAAAVAAVEAAEYQQQGHCQYQTSETAET